MRKTLIITAVLFVFLFSSVTLIGGSDATAVPTDDGVNIEYQIIPGPNLEVRTVPGPEYSGETKPLVIPSTVTIGDKNYSVVEIGASSFKNWNKINSVTIPKTVRKIGEDAFFGCYNVTEIHIDAELKDGDIGENAFCLGLQSHPAECSMYGFTPTRDVGQQGNPYEDIIGKYTTVKYMDLMPEGTDKWIHIALIAVGVVFLLYMGRCVKVKKIKRKKKKR